MAGALHHLKTGRRRTDGRRRRSGRPRRGRRAEGARTFRGTGLPDVCVRAGDFFLPARTFAESIEFLVIMSEQAVARLQHFDAGFFCKDAMSPSH